MEIRCSGSRDADDERNKNSAEQRIEADEVDLVIYTDGSAEEGRRWMENDRITTNACWNYLLLISSRNASNSICFTVTLSRTAPLDKSQDRDGQSIKSEGLTASNDRQQVRAEICNRRMAGEIG